MKYIAGVDEAGRGPLIGDLFMAIVVIDSEQDSFLRSLGVKDSKRLTRSRREELFRYIVGTARVVAVTRITPSAIDRENINTLEIKSLCRLLTKVLTITSIERVYIDAFASPDKIKEHVRPCLKSLSIDNVIAEHGADSLYTVVGAASIVAKVLRDIHVDELKMVYGDFGSGYPSDRRTVDWLKNYYQRHRSIPPIVRRSWKTVENIIRRTHNLDLYIKENFKDHHSSSP